MKPASWVYQPLSRDEPLAYCLMAAKRMRYWQQYGKGHMLFALEYNSRVEAEFWDGQAALLVEQGHTVSNYRRKELGLPPLDDETALPEDVTVPAFQNVPAASGGDEHAQACSPRPASAGR